MTSRITTAARRKTLFSRTLVLTALFVVAAAGSLLSVRSARADAPVVPSKKEASVEVQAVASLLAAQSVGNPTLGASFMQVLWGGGVKDEPPKIVPPPAMSASSARLRTNSSRIAPRVK